MRILKPLCELCLACSLINLPALAQDTTVYHGFTLLDPERQQAVANAYLVVTGDRIVDIGQDSYPRQPDWQYQDMAGTWALPGFTDAHAHITAGPLEVRIVEGKPELDMRGKDEYTRFHALMALAYGITSLRNPAGDPDANARYDTEIAAGRWLGPDAVHAGFTFDPTPIKGGSVYPVGEAAWDAEILRQKNLGMQYIKLYAGLSREELALGTRIAHQHGLKTIAHLDQVSWMEAIDIGIDHLTHALPTSADLLPTAEQEAYSRSRMLPSSTFMHQWFQLVDLEGPAIRELLLQLKASDISLDMTLSVHEIMFFFDELITLLQPEYSDSIHPEILEQSIKALAATHYGWTEADYDEARQAMQKVFAFTRLVYEAGIPMLLGTDTVNGAGVYYRELLLHVQAGLPVWDVLYMATTGNASGIGFRDSGSIATGNQADVVFLDSDPLLDIRAVRNVHGTLSNGQYFTHASLKAMAAALLTDTTGESQR